MIWRDLLTSTEEVELAEHEWQLGVARARVKDHLEWVAKIREAGMQRYRAKQKDKQ